MISVPQTPILQQYTGQVKCDLPVTIPRVQPMTIQHTMLHEQSKSICNETRYDEAPMEHAKLPENLAEAAMLLRPINARYLGTLLTRLPTYCKSCHAQACNATKQINMPCAYISPEGGCQSPSLPPSLAEHYLREDFPSGG